MTKQEIFRAIQDRGGDRAEVWFSGGEDEGGANFIALWKGNKVVENLSSLLHETKDLKEKQFVETLCDPIEYEFHGFAGRPLIIGKLTWTCNDHKVSMDWC